MAPEIRERKGYSGGQQDIFSLGVILFSMAFGVFPWRETTQEDRMFRATVKDPANLLKYHIKTRRLVRSGEVDVQLMDLITQMVTIDLKKRPESL